MTKKGKTKISIYPAWCKGCGICVAFCPGKVLAIGEDGKAHAVNPDACLNCGFCELHCPDFAVEVDLIESEQSKTDEEHGQSGEENT